jgi:hypothetical protein
LNHQWPGLEERVAAQKVQEMDSSDVATILNPWIPVVSTLLGVLLGYWIEQKKDETRRTRDRQERWIEAQQQAVLGLQVAVEEVNHGAKLALEILHDPARAEFFGLVFHEDEPWQQQFAFADRKMRVLATHVADPELRRLVEAYAEANWEVIDSDVANRADLLAAQARLDDAAAPVRVRAGIVVQSLMQSGTMPVEEHKDGAAVASRPGLPL